MLVLTNHSIKGEIPSWWWNLPNLERLVLSYNQLEGIVPPQLYISLITLNQVELRASQFLGRLPHPPSSSTGFPLGLNLPSNNNAVSVPLEMCMMLNSSIFLFLVLNKLDMKIPPYICEETEYLQVLYVSDNNLSGQLPS